ncbi:hypothetical protein HYH02_015268 [Chlamydomonas schloesseri]|uniref:RNA-binding S4 domain-containing protein n=1 Tax=Chlamydomonas schloesseri TaxID=2026947 RepID=A0A835VSJ8_9CHLO|nr:hypothetical protein HYH02_015268 [Chlamydomonas schloesseri]|eukprot:KAG2423929.1 hypothetical protein HYH02_015268 [Chlamydomonas schloesseri]
MHGYHRHNINAPSCRQLGRACSRTTGAVKCARIPLVLRASADTKPESSAPSTLVAGPTFSYRVAAKQATSKLRLDTFLAEQIAAELAAVPNSAQVRGTDKCFGCAADVSRAKIQASIAAGLVIVNGRPASKAGQQLRPGDRVAASLLPPPPVQAIPEAIPLDIKYEDEHVLVINKPAGMVVHVAPGHHTGTLVNALLHHCSLPALDLAPAEPGGVAAAAGSSRGGTAAAAGDGEEDEEADELGEDEEGEEDAQAGSSRLLSNSYAGSSSSSGSGGILRPGIVHRIDKGTSGLLVVAKTETALTRLQAQFKARSVDRLYLSLTVGCPSARSGRVETNISRDPGDRKRMAAAPYGGTRGRTAASSYSVLEPLAGGGSALVQWKLDTGRTHQIRVHAKHIGHPLLGDETYGGGGPAATSAVARAGWPAEQVKASLDALGRPALHALTLGFSHPVTGQRLSFEQPPPEDFVHALEQLRAGR